MSLGSLDGSPTWTLPDGTFYVAGGDLNNCTLPACPVELSVYGYRPTLAGSIALIVLYGICIVAQMALAWRYRTWGFLVAMTLGCVDEMIGYGGRIMMWQNPWGQTGFIMQIVTITIGPVFFSAAIYVMLYKIIMYISPSHSRFKPALFYWVFISFDIVSLVLQAAGGALSSTSNGSSDAGVKIALAGLSIQVITLFCFAVLVVDYMIRSRVVWKVTALSQRFYIFVSFLTLATILIFTRCCYRIYELSEGYSMDSEALRDEPLFIGLEMVMVLVAAYCLIVAHPGPVFNSKSGKPAHEENGMLREQKLSSTSEGQEQSE